MMNEHAGNTTIVQNWQQRGRGVSASERASDTGQGCAASRLEQQRGKPFD